MPIKFSIIIYWENQQHMQPAFALKIWHIIFKTMLNADAKYRLKYASPCIQISESKSSLDIREQNSICFISRICTHILWQLKNSDVFPSSGARRQASWSTWWLCLQERIPDKHQLQLAFPMLPVSVLCFYVTWTSVLQIVFYSPTKTHSDNTVFQFLKIRRKGDLKYLAENSLQPLLSTFRPLMTKARNPLKK